ncbi:hypothetical protein CDD80_3948 [Ophiocordyceps camponoti-rufipedis]|uniref:CN hydrolase domain-containing protein n=1 Tax=Ophiocordyceps camponoti-rufipedis TaxID=2004952 RepID=A0A2C5YZL9_9HYPO|nr:hypothetical protein CDD80_3948 [Ophiocordyceps camponoti-rufipedis]
MRIGCLQFAPQVGDLDNNLNRADALLSRANADDLALDLLVLPEMAFSGYNFKSLNDISPFLEPSGSGITSLWARTSALRYGCFVAAGYPEKVDVSPKWPTGPEYYNSAIVVNADGETVANYRKSFLYYTDETWALEGDGGFYDGFIPGLGSVSIGICMDLNPYKFEAPWNAFEFATHILDSDSNLVIMSMAWSTNEERSIFSRQPNEPDMETLMYWVTRMEPLIRSENKHEIIVIFCNRTGTEDEVTYAGTSAVIGIRDGEVNVYGLLGRGDKELLFVDTNAPPRAKLIYRPGSETEPPSGVETPESSDPQPGGQADSRSRPSALEGNASATSSCSTGEADSSRHTATTSSSWERRFSQPSPSQQEPVSYSTRDEIGKRRVGTSSVPRRLDLRDDTFSAVDGINIPTPSAPSPTPMALRPRLTFLDSTPSMACAGTESSDDDPADFYRQAQTIPMAVSESSWEEEQQSQGPASRTDRGRRPQRDEEADESVTAIERPSSADSSRNTIIHRSKLRSSSTAGDCQNNGCSPRKPTQQPDKQDPERATHPERPVHGRRRTGSGRESAPVKGRFRGSMTVHAPSSPLPVRDGLVVGRVSFDPVNPVTPRAMAFMGVD